MDNIIKSMTHSIVKKEIINIVEATKKGRFSKLVYKIINTSETEEEFILGLVYNNKNIVIRYKIISNNPLNIILVAEVNNIKTHKKIIGKSIISHINSAELDEIKDLEPYKEIIDKLGLDDETSSMKELVFRSDNVGLNFILTRSGYIRINNNNTNLFETRLIKKGRFENIKSWNFFINKFKNIVYEYVINCNRNIILNNIPVSQYKEISTPIPKAHANLFEPDKYVMIWSRYIDYRPQFYNELQCSKEIDIIFNSLAKTDEYGLF